MGGAHSPPDQVRDEMILNKATFEAYGYYAKELAPQSDKLIVTACTLCGRFKVTRKHDYHIFCASCAHKGETPSEEAKAKMRASKKGEKHPMFGKRHSEETKTLMSAAKKGKSRMDLRGTNNSRWKGGKKIYWAKTRAKRRCQLGYTLIRPLAKGEVGHHFTNEYVIGIPSEVHETLSGFKRRKHRTLVLQWLKVNDKKKYKMVLCVLAQPPLNTHKLYSAV